MRSQVQVLAGPPPITPGHSAVGSKPGALAASLGRAGAACPSSPAPPGTPTRGVRHHDHHAPWSPPSPRRQPRGRCATSRRSLFPCPPSSRQPPVLRRPGLPARSSGTRRRAQPGPGPPPTPLTNATSQHRPRLGLLGRRPNRSTARQPTGTRPVPVVTGARRSDLGPTPPPGMGGDGRVRTDGADSSRLDTARADSRRLDAGRVDTRGPDTGRVDSRRPTAGHPDDEPR
jgi:hypothetical protein